MRRRSNTDRGLDPLFVSKNPIAGSARWFRRNRMLFVALVLLLIPLFPLVALADDDDDDDNDKEEPTIELKGFVETSVGGRITDDKFTKDELMMAEARFRLELYHEPETSKFTTKLAFRSDFVIDGITGQTTIDVREASAYVNLGIVDFKVGRQVMTWGVGDLRFINDLFPKDWIAFFIGRDTEYLKAPSNTIRMGMYFGALNVDLAWTPIFTSDNFPTASRLTIYNPFALSLINGQGQDLIQPNAPAKKFRNGEFHLRAYRKIKRYDVALYGYLGFWKEPLAAEMVNVGLPQPVPMPAFSRLAVYGASIQGPLFGGTLSMEGGFYHSLEDSDGDDPFIPNHQVRGLVGYEHALVKHMTVSFQYYMEVNLQYDKLEQNAPIPPDILDDEIRHQITMRWMYLPLKGSRDLILSFFIFYSPNEKDVYMRPWIAYKVTESLRATIGANIVIGADDHTFFGRLEKNTNVYGRLRYSFAGP
jgi:hypothetical protein